MVVLATRSESESEIENENENENESESESVIDAQMRGDVANGIAMMSVCVMSQTRKRSGDVDYDLIETEIGTENESESDDAEMWCEPEQQAMLLAYSE